MGQIERQRYSAYTTLDLVGCGNGWDGTEIEPQAGVYDWQLSDAVINAIRQANLIPVIVLDGSPAWARAPQDRGANGSALAPPADPATFARFAGQFARRYAGQLHFYQIWNEPNIAPHWGNHQIEPVGYAQLLKPAAAAIRAADPTAVILAAALAPTADRGHTAIDEIYFLQRLYAAGAASSFDAVAVEPFGFDFSPNDPHRQLNLLNFQRVVLVRQVMIAAGDGTTPIWAVRFGWNTTPNSPWGTVLPARQAQYAHDALDIAYRHWPWLVGIGWAIDQPIAQADDPAWGFSLTHSLASVFKEWILANPPALHRTADTQREFPLTTAAEYWIVVTGAILLCGWRGYASARLVPWTTWLDQFKASKRVMQIGLWCSVIGLYYLATWPPLIVLCLLTFALLSAAQPQVGLWLAAALLPFYFQHKDLFLTNMTLAIAPAHAALLGLLPAMAMKWRSLPRSSRLIWGAGFGRRSFLSYRLSALAGVELAGD